MGVGERKYWLIRGVGERGGVGERKYWLTRGVGGRGGGGERILTKYGSGESEREEIPFLGGG